MTRVFPSIIVTGFVFLVALGSITAEGQDTTNVLILAVDEGKIEEIKRLLNGGANVNAEDEYGNTALMKAAELGYLEILKLLLDSGAEVNAKDECHGTALIRASKMGRLEVVRLLLNEGADVNARQKFSEPPSITALMWASDRNHPEVVKELRAAMDKIRVELGDARLGITGRERRQPAVNPNPKPLTVSDPAYPEIEPEYQNNQGG